MAMLPHSLADQKTLNKSVRLVARCSWHGGNTVADTVVDAVAGTEVSTVAGTEGASQITGSQPDGASSNKINNIKNMNTININSTNNINNISWRLLVFVHAEG